MFSSPINFLYYHVHAASSGQSWGKLSINLYLSPVSNPSQHCYESFVTKSGWLSRSPTLGNLVTNSICCRTNSAMSAHVFSDSRLTRLMFTCNSHWFLISWSDPAGSFSSPTHCIFCVQTSQHSVCRHFFVSKILLRWDWITKCDLDWNCSKWCLIYSICFILTAVLSPPARDNLLLLSCHRFNINVTTASQYQRQPPAEIMILDRQRSENLHT